jgi:Xaa-Pro aminopeptidase
VLHYIANRDDLKNGELLLIDAGAEYDGYASDITRTFPVNGKFSPEQRELYEVVLAAQSAAIDRSRRQPVAGRSRWPCAWRPRA